MVDAVLGNTRYYSVPWCTPAPTMNDLSFRGSCVVRLGDVRPIEAFFDTVKSCM